MKRAAYRLKKIFTSHISKKGLVSKIYRELSKLSKISQTTQLENGQKNWIDILLKRIYSWQMKRYMKRWSTSLNTREIQIETTWDIATPLSEWLIFFFFNVTTSNAGFDAEKLGDSGKEGHDGRTSERYCTPHHPWPTRPTHSQPLK